MMMCFGMCTRPFNMFAWRKWRDSFRIISNSSFTAHTIAQQARSLRSPMPQYSSHCFLPRQVSACNTSELYSLHLLFDGICRSPREWNVGFLLSCQQRLHYRVFSWHFYVDWMWVLTYDPTLHCERSSYACIDENFVQSETSCWATNTSNHTRMSWLRLSCSRITFFGSTCPLSALSATNIFLCFMHDF